MDVEKKLADYRAKKAREEQITKIKSKFTNVFSKYFQSKNNIPTNELNKEINEPLLKPNENPDLQNLENFKSIKEYKELQNEDDDAEDDDNLNCCSYSKIIYYSLWFILWATLYALFIQLQFGTVFLVISSIVGICLNTRTGYKKPNEISAYSVFNTNCESIDGTLKAEHFEREIRYGSGIMR